ncbi:Glycolipid 2-alpha-mannosyltransferase [uncultured archaeon]|nr:Glycolipid 2-alpha-mannosyltransferase [uncultured archaeon]
MKDEKSVKAAIVYLARSKSGDIANLKRSLSLLDVNFNDKFKYPVIIFHEDINENLMKKIREATRSKVQFEKVIFEIPDFLNKEEIPELVYVDGDCFSMGYRHMCRFFSGIIFHHPALEDYDYYWRLDTDSFLLDNINYDVFQFMQERDLEYGYIDIFKDEPASKGLWDTTKKYIEDNNIKPEFLHKFTSNGVWDRSYYYTNFEIAKLDFWRSDEFMNYFEYLDRSGGIYKYRWGDHVIHLLAISIFVPENKVHRFSDIAYQHQGFINNYSMDPDNFRRLRNLKGIIMNHFVKASTSLKRKSGLYRKFIKLIKRES